jgi:hypothetical protein
VEEDRTTRELKQDQAAREEGERQGAEESDLEEETAEHERRADKAAYLKQKLEERAAAERDADPD